MRTDSDRAVLIEDDRIRVTADGHVTVKWPLVRVILALGAVLGFIIGVPVGAFL